MSLCPDPFVRLSVRACVRPSVRKLTCGHFLAHLGEAHVSLCRDPFVRPSVCACVRASVNSLVDTFSYLNLDGSRLSFACCFISRSDCTSSNFEKKIDYFWRNYAPFSTCTLSCGHFFIPKPRRILIIFCMLLYLEFEYRKKLTFFGGVMPLFRLVNSVLDTFSYLNFDGSP